MPRLASIELQLLCDTALIGDDESAHKPLSLSYKRGYLGMAVPAALHLLAGLPSQDDFAP